MSMKDKMLHPWYVWGILMFFTILFGISYVFIAGYTIYDTLYGLWRIFALQDRLISDYLHYDIGGVGAGLINSGLSGLLVLLFFVLSKYEGYGLGMGALGLTMGLGLLGKNPLNMLPIMLGGLLYSLYTKRPHKEHVIMAVFATCLAPMVSTPAFLYQFGYAGAYGNIVGRAVGVLIGLCIGFFINSMGVFIKKSHEGMNLYNIGFGAGLIAVSIVVLSRTLGFNFYTIHGFVSYGNNLVLQIYLIMVTVFFFACGFFCIPRYKRLGLFALSNIKQILCFKADDNDFYKKYGKGYTYLAMGVFGLTSLIIMIVFNVEYNGPVLGAIISLISWGGFGKSVVHSLTIIAGVILAGFVRYLAIGAALNSMDIYTSAFWGTCLSPMVKSFGYRWGIVVGIVHFAFATNVTAFHAGLNLYNNGFAAGLVCVVMIPLIRGFERRKD